LLIDQRHERRVITSVVQGPGSAIVFYLRQGFRATGEVHEGELVLKLDLPNQAGA
jgi:hypothetical protein